jgi:two-component system response regulator HydG
MRRLGGKTEMQVDVRVVAATNKDLLKALQEGTFREDLFYRLNVLTITLPPLRERREDIPLLIQAFLEEFNVKYQRRIKAVVEAAHQVLLGHNWPGNVRELRNTIERAAITCEGELITRAHLPPSFAGLPRVESPDAITLPVGTTVEDTEKVLILKTLTAVDNNKARAAEVLGISLKTLHNKLHRYGSYHRGPRHRSVQYPGQDNGGKVESDVSEWQRRSSRHLAQTDQKSEAPLPSPTRQDGGVARRLRDSRDHDGGASATKHLEETSLGRIPGDNLCSWTRAGSRRVH